MNSSMMLAGRRLSTRRGLAAVGICALGVLCASAGAWAAAPMGGGAGGTCYANVHDDSGASAVSQSSRDDQSINSRGAADFTLRRSCTVALVEVIGAYSEPFGPANAETVTFYASQQSAPGAVISRQTVQGADFEGDFTIPIGPVTFAPGTYFVSVVVHMQKASGGVWYWKLTNNVKGGIDQWENPGGGLSTCTTWGDVGTCTGRPQAQLDFMVALYG